MTTIEFKNKLEDMTDRKAILSLVKEYTIYNSEKIDSIIDGGGVGDMLKSDYDINNNGTVDIAELAWEASDSATVTGFTVGTNVPGSAVFTDTTYTNLQIKTMYEQNINTNAFTDSEKSKLDSIEQNATSDQTKTEIKDLYEQNINTNAFTDIEKLKLFNIEDGATADQTNSEIKIAYENNFSITSISNDYDMNENIRNILVDLSNNNVIVNLPELKNNLIVNIKIIKTNETFNLNKLNIKPKTIGFIENEQIIILDEKFESIELICNGTDWFII